MSNSVNLNWNEKLWLYDMLDWAWTHPDCKPEHVAVIKTIEQQLNRYGDNHEQHREENS